MNWLFVGFAFTAGNISLYDDRLPEVRRDVFDGRGTSVESITHGNSDGCCFG